MGSYFDSDDVEGRLRDDFTSLYELPQDNQDLSDDILAVEAVVNSYVGRRYATPVTNATAIRLLKTICLDLMERKAWARGAGSTVPEKAQKAEDNAMKLLRDIGEGKITLAGATALAERTTGGAEAIIVDGNEPEFTRDDLEGF